MATTTNYGWTTPDDTALVKDGAAAIRTLGTSVDTTTKNLNPETTLGDLAYRSSTANVKTRLGIGTNGQLLTVAGGVPTWATPAGGAGLVLVKTQTIGSAVSSVTVSDAFSTDYDTYKIVLSGGIASGNCEINMILGATTSGYNQTRYSTLNDSSSPSLFQLDSGSNFPGVFNGSANSLTGFMDISCPFLSKYTSIHAVNQRTNDTRRTYMILGHLANTTSYTAFTITPTDSATFTGGTIKVYGYANS
jgi:hypothetical protein